MEEEAVLDEETEVEQVRVPRVRTTTDEEYLECELTQEELIECSKEQTAQLRQRSSLEGQKKAYNSKIKSEVETCDKLIEELSNKISSQSEYRHVECRKVEDFDAGTLRVIRLDTEEVIVDRRMTRTELHAGDDLFFEADEPAEAGPKLLTCDVCREDCDIEDFVKMDGILKDDNFSFEERGILLSRKEKDICSSCADQLIVEAGEQV